MNEDLTREINKMEIGLLAENRVPPHKKGEFLRFIRKSSAYKRKVALLTFFFHWNCLLCHINLALPVWMRPETLGRKISIFISRFSKNT